MNLQHKLQTCATSPKPSKHFCLPTLCLCWHLAWATFNLTSPSLSLSPLKPCHFNLHLYFSSSPCLPPSLTQTLLKPLTMSQTAKSASSQGTDAKDKGAPAPAASSKATKTGEPGMGSFRVSHCRDRMCAFYFFLKGKESRLHVVPCVSSSRAVICLFTEGLN